VAAPTAASRPGRPLAFLALVIVALVATMFITGNLTPKLALDLKGGTQVTLTARLAEGEGSITRSQLDKAVEIIRNRVNAFGVSESEVAVQGNRNIVVSIPGNNPQTAEQVGKTALLYFRPVLAVGTGVPPPTPTPTATPTGKPTATPSATPTAKPSPTPTKQGRVLTGALTRAAPTPPLPGQPVPGQPVPGQPVPGQPVPGQPGQQVPPVTPDASGTVGTVPPELKKAWDALDCTKEEKTPLGARAAKDKPMVACDQESNEKYVLGPVEVQGSDLGSASALLDPQGAGWEVSLTFKDKGAKDFAKSTTALAAKQPPFNRFAIVLDDLVVSAPSLDKGPITGGQAEITGNFNQSEANALANVLKYGALPLAFDQSDVTQISATLGSDQMRAGLIAGAIGLILVVLYSILYYRGLAIVTVLSLVVASVLTYSVAVVLGRTVGFTLSLPGIAGLIVAIGITADSFVVFFERLRDEVREGRTLRAAVEHGWVRARRTIVAADLVSIFAAGALYFLSVGSVKGFAFTLGLTTLIDLVVVFVFTKPLMTYLARTEFFGQGHRFSGLNAERLGAKPRTATTTTRRRLSGAKEA
jgi:preprotein translocase subunit SecD